MHVSDEETMERRSGTLRAAAGIALAALGTTFAIALHSVRAWMHRRRGRRPAATALQIWEGEGGSLAPRDHGSTQRRRDRARVSVRG